MNAGVQRVDGVGVGGVVECRGIVIIGAGVRSVIAGANQKGKHSLHMWNQI